MEPRFRPSTVNADGVTLEPTWLGWLERTADTARKMEPVAAISWLEMRSYMVNTLLRDTDSVSMAQSLEVRVPLLDTPFAEFVGSPPDAARQRHGTYRKRCWHRSALGVLTAGASFLNRRAQENVHAALGTVAARPFARAY